MKFTKMHGNGNDYIYIDCINNDFNYCPIELSKKLSDRHFGIGADGIILIDKSDVADVKMDIYNADGSRGKMCGNGIRCVSKYVYDNNIVNKKNISIETLSGIKYAEIVSTSKKVSSIKINMGSPIIDTAKIPVKINKERCINEKLSILDKNFYITCVSIGAPHCVIYLDNIEDFDIEKYGKLIEFNQIFSDRVNVDFVHILKDNIIDMRVWERGSGETLACGTGACAVTVSSILNNYIKDKAIIKSRGGKLLVNLDKDIIYMTGPAEFVYNGEIDV